MKDSHIILTVANILPFQNLILLQVGAWEELNDLSLAVSTERATRDEADIQNYVWFVLGFFTENENKIK